MIENLVASLETAKKLKGAGWNKPTAYVWASDGRCVFPFPYNLDGTLCFPAPTAEEILSELPESIIKDTTEIVIKKNDNIWIVSYEVFDVYEPSYTEIEFNNKNLFAAAASMWLWIKENNYLKDKK